MRNNHLLTTSRLRHMTATVESYASGATVLVSYDSTVAAMIGGRLYLLPKWDCSVSTMRHVRTWLREYYGRELYAAHIRKMLKADRATLLSGWAELGEVLEGSAKVGA